MKYADDSASSSSSEVTYNIDAVTGGVVAHTYVQNTILCDNIRARVELIKLLKEFYKRQLNNQPLVMSALKYYIHLDASAIPLSSDKEKQAKQRKSLHEKYVQPFLSHQSEPLLLLLGESGSGKSTYVHWLAAKLWDEYEKNPESYVPMVIECGSEDGQIEQLLEKKLGFTPAEIITLKSLKLLFIFDGYDEKQGNDYNIYEKNKFIDWNAKVLVTCRTRHILESRNYQLYFSSHGKFDCMECYVSPFSMSQVNSFIKQCTAKISDYQKLFGENEKLYQIIENPLMLRMIITVLPEILNGNDVAKIYNNKHPRVMHVQEFTKAEIYKKFIQDWFETEMKRLGKATTTLWNMNDIDTQEAFGIYCEDLAMAMFISTVEDKALLEIEYKEPSGRSRLQSKIINNAWGKFFTSTDDKLRAVRNGCPLQCVDQKYSFYHKSFVEYFIALSIFNELFGQDISENQILEKLASLLINKKLLSFEPDAMQFLAEMLQGDKNRCEFLVQIIIASRKENQGLVVSIAASNAIMILKHAYFNFSGMNFKEINILKANMRGAYCDSTDFSGANLTDVDFAFAWLRRAKLNRCVLAGVNFGEYPYEGSKNPLSLLTHLSSMNLLVAARSINVCSWRESPRPRRVTEVLSAPNFLCMSISKDFDKIAYIKNEDILQYIVLLKLNNKHDIRYFPEGFRISCICINSDATKIALGSVFERYYKSVCNVRIWDLRKWPHDDEDPDVLFGRNVIGEHFENVKSDVIYNQTNVIGQHFGEVSCVHFSEDSNFLASGGHDKTVRVWCLSSRGEVVLEGHTESILEVSLSDNGKIVASCDNKDVRVWDVATGVGKVICEFKNAYAVRVALSKDGKTVAASGGQGIVRVFDVSSGAEKIFSWYSHGIKKHCYHHDNILNVFLSKDANTVATSGVDGTSRIWNTASGSKRLYDALSLDTSSHHNQLYKVESTESYSEILRILVKTKLRKHSIESEMCYVIKQFSKFISMPLNEVFDGLKMDNCKDLLLKRTNITSSYKSEDSKVLIFGCEDTTVHVWWISNGQEKVFHGHKGLVHRVHFCSDLKWGASASYDKTVRVWDIEQGVCRAVISLYILVQDIAIQGPLGTLGIEYADEYTDASSSAVLVFEARDSINGNWQLKWASSYPSPHLMLKECNVIESSGLTSKNHRLLEQHNAILEESISLSSLATQVGRRSRSPLHQEQIESGFNSYSESSAKSFISEI